MQLLRHWRFLCFCLAVLGAASAARAEVVGLLHSERGPGYTAVADAVQSELASAGYTVVHAYVTEVSAIDALLARSPKLLVTLGAAALRTALASETRLPVVASLIPRSAFDRVMREQGRKSTGAVYAIYLDQPFSRQIDLMQLVFPDLKHVGVLWGPDSQYLRPSLQPVLAARGLTERSGTVTPAGSVGEATRQALEEADALLAIADPQVFNNATITNILMATYRAKLGVVAFSPAYVKAGALVGVYSTSGQIGAHTADVARSVIRGATVPAAQYPAEFTLSVNEHVARSLGLSLDESTLTQKLKRMERKP